MDERNRGESKESAADRIFRKAVISRQNDETLGYNISVQLENGQYDIDQTSLKKLKDNVSETYVPREWHVQDVMFYQNDEADGEPADRSEFEKRLKGLGLNIPDISKRYYHRALIAGIR